MTTATRAAAAAAVPPAAGVPAPPPLPDDLEALLRRMRLPHMRRARPRSSPRPKPSGGTPPKSCGPCSPKRSPGGTSPPWPPAGHGPPSRPGRRSTPGTSTCPRSRPPPSPRCGPWNGWAGTRTSSSAGRPAPARPSCLRLSARRLSSQAGTSPGSPWSRSAPSSGGTGPTTPSPGRSPASCGPTSLPSTTSGCCPSTRRRRGPLPDRRRRLRAPQCRGQLESSPVRLRRAHAENPGHRYLTTVLWVSVTSMTARRVSAGQRRGRLIFLCP